MTTRASTAYRFTVTDRYDPSLLALRRVVSDHNAVLRANPDYTGKLEKVTVKPRVGRKGKRSAEADAFVANGFPYTIPMEMGTRFDVYVHNSPRKVPGQGPKGLVEQLQSRNRSLEAQVLELRKELVAARAANRSTSQAPAQVEIILHFGG